MLNHFKNSLNKLIIFSFGMATLAVSQNFAPLTYNPTPPNYQDTAKADGWVVLFDGTEEMLLRNWWLGGGHGGEGKWWIAPDPETPVGGKFWNHTADELVLWSDQQAGGVGGVLHTNRRYKDVETFTWVKAGWGNDGGVFLRTTDESQAWQIVIDYKEGARVGQVWDESANHQGDDRIKTYSLRTNGTTIDPPDAFDQPWSEMWDPTGYNKVYGKVVGRPVTIDGAINDFRTLADFGPNGWSTTNLGTNLDADGMGYIGLQIHQGSTAWEGGPNKYTRVEVRELNEDGVTPLTPIITTSPASLATASLGGSASFTFEANTTNVTIQWQKDGVDIVGANANVLTINPVQASDAGSYTVLLTENTNQRVTRSNPGILPIPVGVKPLPEWVKSIKSKWVNTNILQVSGSLPNTETLVVMDIKNTILGEYKLSKGDFTQNVLLEQNGVYIVTLKGKPIFKPLLVKKINN